MEIRAEGTKSLRYNLKGSNGTQKKRMQNKRIQIKPTLNVKIALNDNY